MARRRGSPWWESVLFCAGPKGTCWEWTAARNSEGYGHLRVDGTLRYTHIIVYEQFNGPVPEGLELDHLCRNRACCSPLHLEPVTRKVNQIRGNAAAGIIDRTGQCRRGHTFDGDNIYVAPKTGERACRECRKLSEGRRKPRSKKHV